MTSTTSTTPAPDAFSRDGHPVKILNTTVEDGVRFAWIKYLDGHRPGPVGGRVAGTEDDPIWEHRVEDGKVLKSGGDYYRDEDWTIERGLQPVSEEPITVRSFKFGEWQEIGYWLDEHGWNLEGHRVVVTFRDENDELLPDPGAGYVVSVWREGRRSS